MQKLKQNSKLSIYLSLNDELQAINSNYISWYGEIKTINFFKYIKEQNIFLIITDGQGVDEGEFIHDSDFEKLEKDQKKNQTFKQLLYLFDNQTKSFSQSIV